MKTEFRTKFLQHLSEKKADEGFTLIELLVVIIIIGILSAIALPSFLNQANKAKESEAKQYVGSMNRQQQAYYLEKDEFTGSLAQLGLGIASETENYVYGISTNATFTGVTNYGNGASKSDTLRSFIGGVQTARVGAASEATTLAVLCQSNDVNSTPVQVSYSNASTGPGCPTNTYSNL